MNDNPLAVAVVLLIYFAPTLSAYSRRHSNASAILALNVFLGWTVIGWIVAGIWAATDNVRKPPPPAPRGPKPRAEKLYPEFPGKPPVPKPPPPAPRRKDPDADDFIDDIFQS